ncbi:MAG: phosphate signaling complex protein PhoU [Opitutales bacterium]
MQHFYEAELESICNKLVLMGRRCVEITRRAMQALEEKDDAIARSVLGSDDEIDGLEKEIDNECVRYISLRGPVASDVRLLTVAMKACHDLERIADEACSISRRVVSSCGLRSTSSSDRYFEQLTDMAVAQLELSLDAFVNRSSSKAFEATRSDKEIDRLHREHVRLLIEAAKSEGAEISATVDLIFVSKSLERIGDHAKNVAEEVIFLLKADDIRHTAEVKNPARM